MSEITDRPSAALMYSGPVSGANTNALPSRIPTSRRSPLPSALTEWWRARYDNLLRAQLASQPPPDEHRPQPVVSVQHIGHLCPPIGEPVLLQRARRDDDHSGGPLEPGEELALPFPLRGPRAEIPARRLVQHAEVFEKLEVLILYVLPCSWKNPFGREEPV